MELPTKWSQVKSDDKYMAERGVVKKAALRVEAMVWPDTKSLAYSAKSRDKSMSFCPFCFFTAKSLITMKRHMSAYHASDEVEGGHDPAKMWRQFVQLNQE